MPLIYLTGAIIMKTDGVLLTELLKQAENMSEKEYTTYLAFLDDLISNQAVQQQGYNRPR